MPRASSYVGNAVALVILLATLTPKKNSKKSCRSSRIDNARKVLVGRSFGKRK